MDVLIMGIALTIGYGVIYKTVRIDAEKSIELFKEGFAKGFEAKHGEVPFQEKKEEVEFEPISSLEEEEEEQTFYSKERWDD